jgi:hypothetical protein
MILTCPSASFTFLMLTKIARTRMAIFSIIASGLRSKSSRYIYHVWETSLNARPYYSRERKVALSCYAPFFLMQ